MNENRKRILQLFHFMCAFAWADLEIQEEEQEMIERLMVSLKVPPEDQNLILTWLEVPPPPEVIDPYAVDPEFRSQIYKAAKAIVLSDGELHQLEKEMLELLRDAFTEMSSAEMRRIEES